jgi:hypothetical protein
MTDIIDENTLREFIKQQRQRMETFTAEMEAISAKLLEIENSASPPDPIALAALRAEFDRIGAASKALIEETNKRVRSLRELLRPNLPSS